MYCACLAFCSARANHISDAYVLDATPFWLQTKAALTAGAMVDLPFPSRRLAAEIGVPVEQGVRSSHRNGRQVSYG